MSSKFVYCKCGEKLHDVEIKVIAPVEYSVIDNRLIYTGIIDVESISYIDESVDFYCSSCDTNYYAKNWKEFLDKNKNMVR